MFKKLKAELKAAFKLKKNATKSKNGETQPLQQAVSQSHDGGLGRPSKCTVLAIVVARILSSDIPRAWLWHECRSSSHSSHLRITACRRSGWAKEC